MRVRPQRQADRRLLGLRRPHARGSHQAAEADAPPPASAAEEAASPTDEATGAAEEAIPDEHVAERRHRAYVTPEDHALYRCECGYQFEADVSASVSCPHCGRSQAW